MAKAIDAKYLKGLVYRSSAFEKDKENGTTRHLPVKRDLTPEDVLDWKDNGSTITLVTADGQKYVVEKKAAAQGEQK